MSSEALQIQTSKAVLDFKSGGRFPLKRLRDGRALVNLACGTRTHWSWNNLDFSPYARLRRHPYICGALRTLGFVTENRSGILRSLDPDIVAWDLRKGIPYPNETFDAVYHSHFLEHIPRDAARGFLAECRRVLKRNAVIRIVVPDLELLAVEYLASVKAVELGEPNRDERYTRAVYELFDQMVRKEFTGDATQTGWKGRIERRIRGNAAKTGELHRWMYDRVSLTALLESVGFRQVSTMTACDSQIGEWESFRLDAGEDGTSYKPESLYIEAVN